MLSLLKIKNLALVDTLTWEIGVGLVGVTGETGAGKSVIVGALKMILGERANKSLIRTGESQCTVEAVFNLEENSPIWDILIDSGFEVEDRELLIIKRVIGAESNKQFINNSPCVLSLLKQIGAHLVDLHGPHDHQSLLSNERQLSMLDSYAGLKQTKSEYKKTYNLYLTIKKELEDIISAEKAGDSQLSLLKFQLEEIQQAEINLNEEEDLEETFKKAQNSSKIQAVSSHINTIFSSGLSEQLSDLQRNARELERLDTDALNLFTGLDSAVLEIQELEKSIYAYVENTDIDPAEFTRVEERINTFETLKRKYGPTLEDVVNHAHDAEKQLTNIDNREERIIELEEALTEQLKLVRDKAAVLTEKRKKLAPKLAKDIAGHLADLGFKQAAFELSFSYAAEPMAWGMERVEFEFGPNLGEPLKPLKSIASSGEISRVMLAVKSSLTKQDSIPLMVFDEIDANVGGEIARSVGEKMAVLGANHQVLSITHFPQVAAVANSHYVVEKTVTEGRTFSSLNLVEGEVRVAELVRMLGGGDGKEAREMAASLLKE